MPRQLVNGEEWKDDIVCDGPVIWSGNIHGAAFLPVKLVTLGISLN